MKQLRKAINYEYEPEDYSYKKAIIEDMQDYIEDFEYRSTDKDICDNIISYRFSIHKSLYERVKIFCTKRQMTISELFKISLKDYGLLTKYPKNLELIKKEKSQQLKVFITERDNYFIGLQIKTSGLSRNEYIEEAIKLRLKNSKGYTNDSLFEICNDTLKEIDGNKL